MRRRVLVLLVAALATLSTLGCVCGGLRVPTGIVPGGWVRGSGDMDVEERSISGVTEVELASFGYLHIEIGEQEGIRVEAEDNLLRYIETEVDGNRLTIRHRRGTVLRPTQPIDYYMTVRELSAIVVSGAGNVDVTEVRTGRFSVRISGAGGVDLDGLQADEIETRISGAGNLEIADGAVDEYLHILESYYENGKRKHRFIASLGRVDQIAGKIGRVIKGLSKYADTPLVSAEDVRTREACSWGPVLLARWLYEHLGLGEIIRRCCARRAGSRDVSEAAFVLIANRLSDPGSEHGLARWLECHYVCGTDGKRWEPDWLPLRAIDKQHRVRVRSAQLQMWYRTLDALLESQGLPPPVLG